MIGYLYIERGLLQVPHNACIGVKARGSRCCGLALSHEVGASQRVNLNALFPIGQNCPRKNY